jgi:hypothetical protein
MSSIGEVSRGGEDGSGREEGKGGSDTGFLIAFALLTVMLFGAFVYLLYREKKEMEEVPIGTLTGK